VPVESPLAVVLEMPVSRRAVLDLGSLCSRHLPATLPDSIIVSALGSWLRFVHGYGPVVEHRAIELANGLLSASVVHLHKSEPFGSTGISIGDHMNIGHLAEWGKKLS
jgi:hypothetical protein